MANTKQTIFANDPPMDFQHKNTGSNAIQGRASFVISAPKIPQTQNVKIVNSDEY